MASFSQTLGEATGASASSAGGTATTIRSNNIDVELNADVTLSSAESVKFIVYEDVDGDGTFENFEVVKASDYSGQFPLAAIGGSNGSQYAVNVEMETSDRAQTPTVHAVSLTFSGFRIQVMDESMGAVMEPAGGTNLGDGLLMVLLSDIVKNGEEVDITVYEDLEGDGSIDNFQRVYPHDGDGSYRLDHLRGSKDGDYWLSIRFGEPDDITTSAVVNKANLSFGFREMGEQMGVDDYYPQAHGDVVKRLYQSELLSADDETEQPYVWKLFSETRGVLDIVDKHVSILRRVKSGGMTNTALLSDLRDIVSVRYKLQAKINPDIHTLTFTFFEDTDGDGEADNVVPIEMTESPQEGELPFTGDVDSNYWFGVQMESEDSNELPEVRNVTIETLRQKLSEVLRIRR